MSESISDKVHEVVRMLQSAAGEVGFEIGQNPQHHPEYKAKIDALHKNGVDPQFFGECIADDLYDDPEFLSDLMGDQCFGHSQWDELMVELAKEGRAFAAAVKILTNRRKG
jgi:hypothetical protein